MKGANANNPRTKKVMVIISTTKNIFQRFPARWIIGVSGANQRKRREKNDFFFFYFERRKRNESRNLENLTNRQKQNEAHIQRKVDPWDHRVVGHSETTKLRGHSGEHANCQVHPNQERHQRPEQIKHPSNH